MKKINKPELFEKTLIKPERENIPIIQKIEGSYFNVMGLPVVELVDRLNSFTL